MLPLSSVPILTRDHGRKPRNMLSPETRLAFVIILSLLQLIFLVFEITWSFRYSPWYTWELKRFQSISVLVAVLGFIFAFASWVSLGTAQKDVNSSHTFSIESDVGGIGVRIAFWTQEGVLFVSAFIGRFLRKPMAGKEVGAGLIITQTSFSIAFLVQMKQGTLSAADAAIGSMILDALNMALSVQLFMKRPLASRWQICIVLLVQLLGLAIIAIIMAGFSQGQFIDKSRQCFTFFWWAWLSSCSPITTKEVVIFWIYYGFRSLNFVHNCCFSLKHTREFDRCDKSQSLQRYIEDQNEQYSNHIRAYLKRLRGLSQDNLQQLFRPSSPGRENQGPENSEVLGCQRTVLKLLDDSDTGFRGSERVRKELLDYLLLWMSDGTTLYWVHRYTTINFYFIANAVFVFISMAGAEIALRDIQPNQSGPNFSIGQVTALVIAASTALRELWIIWFTFFPWASRSEN